MAACTWLRCIGALVLCSSSCGGRSADPTGTMKDLAPEYVKLIQERPHFGVYALINNVACERCGMKALYLQKGSSCLPKNVNAKRPVCMREEQYLLEYGDNVMGVLECYIKYLEVNLDQLYCLLKANEVDKKPALSAAPTTAQPVKAMFMYTATVKLSLVSHPPQYNSAHRKHSGSAAKRNSLKSSGADNSQRNPWHDLYLMEQSLPTDDLFGEARRPKAPKGNQETKRRNKKRKELGGSNVLRQDRRQWPRPVRSETDYRHQDKNTFRGRQISKYDHAENEGGVYARRDGRGQRRRGSGLHARRPGLGNRYDEQERRRMPSRLRGDGGRDRRNPAQESSVDDYNDWPSRGANRHSYASWESYDRDRDEDLAYVRDRPPGALEAFDIGRYFRRRAVRARRKTRHRHDLYYPSGERIF